ncbi:MAG: PP2C family protein-serine/threonine phosphatase [Mucilaginibacter polytrichastri]|nr:PP2C family protein-serine/threonine phosphatase [Mucilaginibacter polytrichastri]
MKAKTQVDSTNEEELIRLLLKRQAELNALLEITQAINRNTSTIVLLEMLEFILQRFLRVGVFRFLIQKEGNFVCVSQYGGVSEPNSVLQRICASLENCNEPTKIDESHPDGLNKYDYFIPFHQKNKPQAFVLIGKFKTTEELLNNDLNFIQTLINVIVVALENKKLFKERIQAERFQREMELASQMQNMLIPLHLEGFDQVEISSRYQPHENIGGDYFDVIELDEDEMIWCIADVSGKGVSAALLMSNFQASLHALVSANSDLRIVVEKLNRVVFRNTKGEKFITLFLAKYNRRTRTMQYVNAGHNPPFVCHRNDKISALKEGTMMIGVFDELPFLNSGERQIPPGTTVFNYTDGLIDADNQDLSVDEKSLMDWVGQHAELDPGQLNDVILNEVKQAKKTARPIDDITLLTLRFS